MRSICTALWMTVAWIVLATMVYLIYGVLSQPIWADEKAQFLKPGYMPKAVEAPQIDSKAFSRSEGYLYSPKTGETTHVEILTYGKGKNATYTVRTGRDTIRVSDLNRITPKED